MGGDILHAVRHHDDGEPAGMKVIDELQKLCTSGRVEAGNRLVEHEYTGAHGEHAGKSAAALLTAREFKGAFLRNFIASRPTSRRASSTRSVTSLADKPRF